MEDFTKDESFQKWTNYLEESKHRGQIISQSAWFSNLAYSMDVQVESHVCLTTDNEPNDVYVELGINKEGDNIASIVLSPREAYQLGEQLEKFGRELACKYVDYLVKEEKLMEEIEEKKTATTVQATE